VSELELSAFKRIAVAWHLVCIGKPKDAGGIQIRECNVLSTEVRTILKWVIRERI